MSSPREVPTSEMHRITFRAAPKRKDEIDDFLHVKRMTMQDLIDQAISDYMGTGAGKDKPRSQRLLALLDELVDTVGESAVAGLLTAARDMGRTAGRKGKARGA